MLKISEKMKEKIKKAQSAEEVAVLLRPSGVDEVMATQIWNELSGYLDDKQLSVDELESISGGADRDWLSDGCAATVKAESWCGSNDSCHLWDVTYDHEPVKLICPKCGINLYLDHVDYAHFVGNDPKGFDTYHYRCKKCGYNIVHKL